MPLPVVSEEAVGDSEKLPRLKKIPTRSRIKHQHAVVFQEAAPRVVSGHKPVLGAASVDA